MNKKEKEKFNKLNQLDRIEYFLYRKELEESRFTFSNVCSTLGSYIYLGLWITIIILLFYIAFGVNDHYFQFMKMFFVYLRIWKFLIIAVLVGYLASLFYYLFMKKKLNKRFFEKEEKEQ